MNNTANITRPAIVAALGIILLGSGIYLHFGGASVDDEDRARCEQIVIEKHGDNDAVRTNLLPKCNEAGMVAMMESQANMLDANEAAQAIASANKGDLLASIIGYTMIGTGFAAIFVGVSAISRMRRNSRMRR